MVRVGAVGCGGIGLIHQRAFQSHAGSRLVAVCDRIREKAGERAGLLGVNAYTSVAEMLEAEELDALDVVTADTLRVAPCLEALEAGKHVLVEKPITIEVAEAQRLVAETARRGLHLAVNHNRRFGLAYTVGRRWLASGPPWARGAATSRRCARFSVPHVRGLGGGRGGIRGGAKRRRSRNPKEPGVSPKPRLLRSWFYPLFTLLPSSSIDL
jgi:predicted dehydrogenase